MEGAPCPKRRGPGGAHRPVLELPHLLLMGVHAGLILSPLPGQLELRCLQGDARGLSPARSGSSGTPTPPPHPVPGTHQLQLLLLALLEAGEVLRQVGAAELTPQAALELQHLAGDAAEGRRDLVHQLPVARKVVVRSAAQICAVTSGE